MGIGIWAWLLLSRSGPAWFPEMPLWAGFCKAFGEFQSSSGPHEWAWLALQRSPKWEPLPWFLSWEECGTLGVPRKLLKQISLKIQGFTLRLTWRASEGWVLNLASEGSPIEERPVSVQGGAERALPWLRTSYWERQNTEAAGSSETWGPRDLSKELQGGRISPPTSSTTLSSSLQPSLLSEPYHQALEGALGDAFSQTFTSAEAYFFKAIENLVFPWFKLRYAWKQTEGVQKCLSFCLSQLILCKGISLEHEPLREASSELTPWEPNLACWAEKLSQELAGLESMAQSASHHIEALEEQEEPLLKWVEFLKRFERIFLGACSLTALRRRLPHLKAMVERFAVIRKNVQGHAAPLPWSQLMKPLQVIREVMERLKTEVVTLRLFIDRCGLSDSSDLPDFSSSEAMASQSSVGQKLASTSSKASHRSPKLSLLVQKKKPAARFCFACGNRLNLG